MIQLACPKCKLKIPESQWSRTTAFCPPCSSWYHVHIEIELTEWSEAEYKLLPVPDATDLQPPPNDESL